MKSIIGLISSYFKYLRDLYLSQIRWSHYKIGSHFHSGRNVCFWAKNNITIGDNFYIGRNSQIECDATIGNNVIFANCVALVGRYDHHYLQVGTPTRLASQIRDNDYTWKGLQSKIIIEDDVWIGYGAIILSGVKIGKGSIVAAGSVITKNVEPYTIVGGNPANFIKMRFTKEEIKHHESLIYEKVKH